MTTDLSSYCGYRFQPEIISYSVWSGRLGSLLTPAPHRSGHAGSSASGSSADGFATLRWRSERPLSAEEDIAREGGGTASTALTSAATDG